MIKNEFDILFSNNSRRMHGYPMIRCCGRRRKITFTELCNLPFPPLTRKKKRYRRRLFKKVKDGE